MPIPSIRTQYKRGPSGVAHIENSEKSVIILFPSGDRYEFLKDDDSIKVANIANIPSGESYIQLSVDKTQLQNLRPASGSFYVKFAGFSHGKDSPPMPKRYEGMGKKQDGTPYPYSYEAFTPLLSIQKGAWVGTILTANLRYLFVDAGDGETAGIKQGGKHATLLNQFLELAGLDYSTDTIPLTDNILPWLEKVLVGRDKMFMVVIDEGWVVAFGPPPDA